MLDETSCDVFNQPFFQFAQMKTYCPERIGEVKEAYRFHWTAWRDLVRAAARELGGEFDEPHIEKWCNGWQVRAHFFAFFKYREYGGSAPIFSLLLNRRRLTVALDWHSYKAASSSLPLSAYRNWPSGLHDIAPYRDFEIWCGSDSEYADHRALETWFSDGMVLPEYPDFLRIGRHIERGELCRHDAADWIVQTVRLLQPLYENCFA